MVTGWLQEAKTKLSRFGIIPQGRRNGPCKVIPSQFFRWPGARMVIDLPQEHRDWSLELVKGKRVRSRFGIQELGNKFFPCRGVQGWLTGAQTAIGWRYPNH